MKKHYFWGLVVIVFFLGVGKIGLAAPAAQQEVLYTQPNGQTFKATTYGDEFFNYVVTEEKSVIEERPDGYWYYKVKQEKSRQNGHKVGIDPVPENVVSQSEVVKNDEGNLERTTTNRSRLAPEVPVLNKQQNLLTILVEFNDKKLESTEQEWEQKLFDPEGKSLKNYYLEETNQRIDVTPVRQGETVKNGVIKVSLDRNHPDQGSGFNSPRLANEALKSLEGKIDFSAYDTNKDTVISPNELHIMFIIAGYEQSAGKNSPGVWAHKIKVNQGFSTIDNIQFTDFTMFGEQMAFFLSANRSTTIGVATHEFGHDLGLPDLYNTESINGVSSGQGIGITSLMAGGSWGGVSSAYVDEVGGTTPVGLDPYSRIQLGAPVIEKSVLDKEKITLKNNSKEEPTIVKVDSNNPSEYFLLENRQITGYNQGMTKYTFDMSGGIGVYRVNTAFNGNLNREEQLVTILEADERTLGYSRYKNNEIFFSQPFFSAEKNQPIDVNELTKPSTLLSDGTAPGTKFKILSPSNEQMDVFIGNDVPIKSIVLTADKQALEVNESVQIKSEIKDAFDERVEATDLNWTSSNENVATVDETGVVQGKMEGATTIVAASSDGTVSASMEITVQQNTYFGTSRWSWNGETQTITFYKGKFPNTGVKGIKNLESESLLMNKKVKKIRFAEPIQLSDRASSLFEDLISLEEIDGMEKLDTSNVTDMSYMFYRARALKKIDLSYFNTTNVKNMSYMFSNTDSLTEINVSSFNTSKVTNMQSMFEWTKSLKKLDLSNFNTSNVTTMNAMFSFALSLDSINVTSFDTKNVKNGGQLFYKTESLTELDLSSFDTSHMTYMNGMLSGITNVTKIVLGDKTKFSDSCTLSENKIPPYTGAWINTQTKEKYSSSKELLANHTGGEYIRETNYESSYLSVPWKWDAATQTVTFGEGELTGYLPSKNIHSIIEKDVLLRGAEIKKIVFSKPLVLPEDSSSLFRELRSLEDIDGMENLDTSKVTTMSYMFSDTRSLTSLDLSHFDTSQVTQMNDLFSRATQLKELNLSTFDTSKVTTMRAMFYQATALERIMLADFITKNVKDMSYMFSEATSLKEVPIAVFDTSNVTKMSYMFSDTHSLTSIDLSNFDTSNVTLMDDLFSRAIKLKELDLSNFDTRKAWTMRGMFYQAAALEKITISDADFITKNVTDMAFMFGGTTSLKEVPVATFDTSKVTNMYYMFYEASSLKELTLTSFDTSKVTNMGWMFYNAQSLERLNIATFDTAKVTAMDKMFEKANNLKNISLGNQTKFADSYGLPEKKEAPYTGAWVNIKTKERYPSSKDMLVNHRQEGEYIRETK